MNIYETAAKSILSADAILIGASNGLSITEGLHLFANNDTFEYLFHDFKQKYGLRCILDGFFYPWKSLEEQWHFLIRLINHYCLNYTPTTVMKDLRKIVGEKPYFIITSNSEGHFEMSGFEAEYVNEVEGNWIELECSNHCHDILYPSIPFIRELAGIEKKNNLTKEMLPRCPKCGALLQLYKAQPPKSFVLKNQKSFLEKYHNKKLVILELGIGWRNKLIKAPLMTLAAKEPNTTYITINLGEVYIPDSIKNKSIGINASLDIALNQILQHCRSINLLD